MNRSTPGLPVHHQLPEFTQTHVHRVSDAIQPSHPLLSPSPPAPNPSQHQVFSNESALHMKWSKCWSFEDHPIFFLLSSILFQNRRDREFSDFWMQFGGRNKMGKSQKEHDYLFIMFDKELLLLLLLSHFSCVWLCLTPWTAAHQAPLSTGFSRQEYWSGLPVPSPWQRANVYKERWAEINHKGRDLWDVI